MRLYELLQEHFGKTYKLLSRYPSSHASHYFNIFCGEQHIAIAIIGENTTSLHDPRMSEIDTKSRPFFVEVSIDFHNPNSFDILDKKLEEMRDFFHA
jgi:hypothetical protein